MQPSKSSAMMAKFPCLYFISLFLRPKALASPERAGAKIAGDALAAFVGRPASGLKSVIGIPLNIPNDVVLAGVF